MGIVESIKKELKENADSEKAEFLPIFFKAIPGGYGEGDQFLGVKVPIQRKIAKKYFKNISLNELTSLIRSPFHEHRLTALFILVNKFESEKDELGRENIVDYYLNNIDCVNNWDLVDSSAYKILGVYLFEKNRDMLYELASSDNLWEQRIAIISTRYFIRKEDFNETLNIAEILLQHEHDLIHKAVGWMLREVGKKNFDIEFNFLIKNYKKMPRTMLRYAIEKFEPELRNRFVNYHHL